MIEEKIETNRLYEKKSAEDKRIKYVTLMKTVMRKLEELE